MLEREFQKKRKLEGRIYSKTTAVILLIVVAVLVRATWNMYRARAESKKEFEKVSHELDTLREREKVLTADIDRLNTAKGTEEEIRKKFNVAKEGEGVVYVVDSEQGGGTDTRDGGFWDDVWGGVKRVFDF